MADDRIFMGIHMMYAPCVGYMIDDRILFPLGCSGVGVVVLGCGN
jgi:hypothetical protein